MAILTRSRQQEIDQKIEQIKLDVGLSYPKDNLQQIIEAIGVEVLSADLPDFEGKRVKGVIRWSEKESEAGAARIYLNQNLSDTTKLFTLAHELGHFILHPNEERLRIDLFDYSQDTKESEQETEANYFAASLLVPKEKLVKLIELTNDLDAIAQYFGVSRPVVETRMRWIQTN